MFLILIVQRITLLEIALISPMIICLGWAIPNLMTSGKKGLSNKLMGVFMLNMFLFFLATTSFYFASYEYFIFLDPIFMFSLTSIFPIICYYLKSVIHPNLKFSGKDFIHFLPSFFFLVSAALIYTVGMSSTEKYYYVNTCLTEGCDWVGGVLRIQVLNLGNKIFFSFQAVFYLFLFFRLIRRYTLELKNHFSNLENLRIRWMYLFYSLYFLSVLVGIPTVFGGHESILNNESMLIVVFFILSSIFYALAWIEYSKFLAPFVDIDILPDVSAPYADLKKLKEDLLTYFHLNKPYLNADLKLEDVQNALNSNRTYISQLINQEFKTNFCMFVNQFRVTEAKKLFRKEACKNFSNEYIGKLAGFGNYHSFIQAFKYFEDTTPSKYRKREENVYDEVEVS